MANKLPPAKAWRERNIDDWNTTSFHAYLEDLHTKLFGCDYRPFPSYVAEKGWLGDLIGTAGKNAKPRTATNSDVKRFIDEAFASYVPTPKYPGTSFGWVWKYRANVWQRIQTEAVAQKRRKASAAQAQQSAMTDEELEAWL